MSVQGVILMGTYILYLGINLLFQAVLWSLWTTPVLEEKLDHDVTIEEIEEYFTNYIVNESLGIIANVHVVFADKEPLKAESQPCIELPKLFSVAEDWSAGSDST
ncbi:unnamed protein product [Urochloa humidicola]